MGHGVLGTASPPSLEQTMGGGSITPKHGSGYSEQPQRGGGSSPGPHLGQDLHMTPIPHINGNSSPKTNEIP